MHSTQTLWFVVKLCNRLDNKTPEKEAAEICSINLGLVGKAKYHSYDITHKSKWIAYHNRLCLWLEWLNIA